MPLFTRSGGFLLRAVGTIVRAVRLLLRAGFGSVRWTGRRVARVREKGAGGEAGMIRLFDLHAASCAGDTLIAIGLAGTIFFNAPLGEARSKVALYLLITMVPFALLAPVVGPLLDHFRHGRRYALAATMLGRAFLAWLISDYIHGFGLYPAAFGVLALSRAYGVARSAAVPRLLPEGIGLSQAGARASVYGSIAGGVVIPIGLAAFWFGPQWPLRVASVIFLVGMVIALRLPPRADSDPPETVPRAFQAFQLRRGGRERALSRGGPSGRLVIAALVGSATLRALYGFLLLFLAFAIKAGHLDSTLFGRELGDELALGVVGAALGVGGFLATALGTRLRIRRPVALQATGLVLAAGSGVVATLWFSLALVALLCLLTSAVSGIAKLAGDATIQERVPERLRATAFAHSETILMLAFVAGGALGLIPIDGRIGVGVLAGLAVVAAGWAIVTAARLRGNRLSGRALADAEQPDEEQPEGEKGPADVRTGSVPTGRAERTASAGRVTDGHADRNGSAVTGRPANRRQPGGPRTGGPASPVAAVTPSVRGRASEPPDDRGAEDESLAPPGYHIYRPSSAVSDRGDEDSRRPTRGGP
ncbi:MFS transporter [Micromonospora sp. HM5-17]|uniref:MFS transporter n=1 Tax=Micromonospora sp. HM5-17 TaxID=2487710 RepID=UPI000F491616|nr:MFS transporter [Micromonospora sp. HM5-17]ROT34384.1 MFS transporter [Micromonospora sp. HM5-17]